MEVSKVSFSQKTRELMGARPLSKIERARLRRQRILDFIREQPNGEARKSELIAAAGLNPENDGQYQTGWAMLRSMEKKGIIRPTPGSNPKNGYIKQWIIPADIKVRNKTTVTNDNGKMTFPEGDGEVTIQPVIDRSPHVEESCMDMGSIKEKAKEFSWAMSSDSLRAFIAWLER